MILTYTGGGLNSKKTLRMGIRQHHNAGFGTAFRKPILGKTIGSSEEPKRGKSSQKRIQRIVVVGFRSSEDGKRGIRKTRWGHQLQLERRRSLQQPLGRSWEHR